jgi:CRISPR-associated protein Cas1
MAAAVVVGKAFNARTVLQRAVRDHGDDDSIKAPIERVVRRLEWVMDGVKEVATLDSVRGLEGEASREYFGVFDHLITSQKEAFFFRERSRRPPLDNMNCLLSFIYTLLMNDVRGALEGVGLDPQVGFLHRDRSGRASLALDMMEEFRPAFADRLALSLVNLRQVQAKDFKKQETGGVLLSDDARKEVLVAYQKRKQEEIEHPFLEEKTQWGLLFHIQALLLARYVRGDLDGYPPFLWR